MPETDNIETKLAQRQSPVNIFSPKEQPTVYHYARVPNARQVLNLAEVHIFLFFQEKSVSSKLVCTGSELGTNTLALFTGFYSIFCARHQSSFVVARSQIYLLDYIDLYGKISRKTLTFCPGKSSEAVTRDILSEERNLLSLPCYRPQTKFAKVMFLQVSVILSTGGGVRGCSWVGHAWLLWGGVHGCSGWGGHAWLLWGACVVTPGGGHAWLLRGACMVALGGMHGCSGGGMCGCSQGVVCVVFFGGVCMVFSMRYGQ